MALWFYGENGQQAGPVDDTALNELVTSGRINGATMLWREGMPAWLTHDQLRANGGLYPQPTPQSIGYGMTPATSGLAIASMICGILTLVTCMVFLGIPAVICGHMAMNEIDKSPVPRAGRGMAVAGLACGYLGLVICLWFIGSVIFSVASRP
jgi:hypothetical protein